MDSIGNQLREARQRQNISLEQIEADTKIRKTYLTILETDDYTQLPPKVYAIGFMKQYCTYLRFTDEVQAEIMAAFKAAAFPEQHPGAEVSEAAGRRPEVYRRKTFNPWIAVLLVVALILGTMTGKYFAERGGAGESPALTPPPVVSNEPAPAPEPEPEAPTVYTDITLAINLKPEFKSWVRVSVDGAVAYEGTLNGGDSRVFTGRESILIRAGNSQAVELTVNETPIADFSTGPIVNEREFFLRDYVGGEEPPPDHTTATTGDGR
jgi:cytoskeletal protein RodZ